MKKLTEKQSAVLEFIKSNLATGKPFPSLSEIGSFFGFSRNSAKAHVDALEKKGLIKKQEQRVSPFQLAQDLKETLQGFPLMATISAGVPDMVEESHDKVLNFDLDYFGNGNLKALEVNGDSMLGDSICDGDIAIIKPQNQIGKNEIAAIQVEGEGLTLKRMNNKNGAIDLLPSNPEYPVKTYPADHVQIVGKLVGVVRRTARR